MLRAIKEITKVGVLAPVCGSLLLSSCQNFSSTNGDENKKAPLRLEKKDPQPSRILASAKPGLLNANELKVLLRKHGENTSASRKADALFSSPFIDNSAYRKNGLPKPTQHPKLGASLRVSTWNIEKSIHVKEVAEVLSSEEKYISKLQEVVAANPKKYAEALRQRSDIASSDILLCQEMDIGHCRSEYVFAAKHLAKKMGLNFVYAPQQLEIDPSYLGVSDVKFENTDAPTEVCSDLSRYKGVFGVAVLSRYPIKRVQVFPLKTEAYDWYAGEILRPDFVEKGRRFGAKRLFNINPTREVKKGGRGFTRVDLHVPGVPHETISVINIHLEIKVGPETRVKQIKEILSYISEIKNPVIMAGDFNSASRDVSSTSLWKASSGAVKEPSNIASAGLFLANVTGVNQVRGILNGYKNFQNPIAWNIPAIFPSKTRSLFKCIQNFRFADGGAFDFRGDRKRSINKKSGLLANSNQRSKLKGFTQTFALPNTIGPVGCERLDWIFVKSFLTDPKDKKGPYRLAPHFGETLYHVNTSMKKKYSDHHPITTVLPLTEPDL